MKKHSLKTYFLSFLMITSSALLFTACDKDDDDNNDNRVYNLSGSASGSQEVPAVTTSATGNIDGSYNTATNTLTYNISWTGLSGVVTDAHFHGPAAAGVSAGVLVPITVTTSAATGSASGSVVLVDSVENALLDGRVYYNIHTAQNPNGEIRGQISTAKN